MANEELRTALTQTVRDRFEPLIQGAIDVAVEAALAALPKDPKAKKRRRKKTGARRKGVGLPDGGKAAAPGTTPDTPLPMKDTPPKTRKLRSVPEPPL